MQITMQIQIATGLVLAWFVSLVCHQEGLELSELKSQMGNWQQDCDLHSEWLH